jgi:hypothetical protein
MVLYANAGPKRQFRVFEGYLLKGNEFVQLYLGFTLISLVSSSSFLSSSSLLSSSSFLSSLLLSPSRVSRSDLLK